MAKTPQDLLATLNQELAVLELHDRAPLTAEAASAISFDDLIVNSLDALQVAMCLEEASGREINLAELRRFPSVMTALDHLAAG